MTKRLQSRLALSDAKDVISRGGVLAYPTDTTYALGVDAFQAHAVERLVSLKGREGAKPISIAVADIQRLRAVAHVSALAERLISNLLPGALTIVLPAIVDFPKPIVSGEGFVGVRIPDDAFCLRLLAMLDGPITATSANPAGIPAAMSVEDFGSFAPAFVAGIDLLVDGGSPPLRGPSTVIEVRENVVNLIREGVLPFAEVLRVAELHKS